MLDYGSVPASLQKSWLTTVSSKTLDLYVKICATFTHALGRCGRISFGSIHVYKLESVQSCQCYRN